MWWEVKTSGRYSIVATAKHTYASCCRLCVGATCNMVRSITEAACQGGKGQCMSRPSEKILRYPCQRLSTPTHEASAAERQAMEAVSYFSRSLSHVLRNRKDSHEARFTSFYIGTPNMYQYKIVMSPC